MNATYIKQQLDEQIRVKGLHIKAYLKEEEVVIMQRAQELMQNIFVFDKVWDMERCRVPYKINPLDFSAQRNGDEEWTFMLNRMDYLCYLVQAYILSENKQYLIKCLQIMEVWISQHEDIQPSMSTRTLDCAIRVHNMYDALLYLYAFGIVSEHSLIRICESIEQQIVFMHNQYVNKYTLSNWGSIQTCVIASLLPLLKETFESNEIYKWAMRELAIQFDIQVYEDGMFWEQSTMYHVEVLNYGMYLIYHCNQLNIPLQTCITQAIYRLAKVLFQQETPTCQMEAFGDSDYCSIKDVMCRASYLFRDANFKTKAYTSFDVQSAYAFGQAAANVFALMQPMEDASLHFDGIQSGMYTHRSSLDENASFTMFNHGSLGSGHGHCDNLHVSLYYQGLPFLIDNGRYTYCESNAMREYLKSMYAHNSFVIDDAPVCVPLGSWDNQKFGIVLKPYVSHHEFVHYYEGCMIDDATNAMLLRKMFVIDPNIWLICDEAIQKGNHEMRHYFHFHPDVEVMVANDIYLQNEKVKLKMQVEGSAVLQETQCSLAYNELQKQNCIVVSHPFKEETKQISSFYDAAIQCQRVAVFQDDTIAAEDLVSARKFVMRENEYYLCIVFHKEVFHGRKIFYCEGHAFHAKSIVIHCVNNKAKQYVCKT